LGNGSRRRGLAPRVRPSGKAKNFERVSGPGDGHAKASTNDTLKANDHGQRGRLTAEEETGIAKARSGEHGEPGSR